MLVSRTNRRAFIAGLGGAAAWPMVARGQQPDRIRRIGVLAPGASDAAVQRVRVEAFVQALQPLGWSVGRNLQLDARWATSDADLRKQATELVAAAARRYPGFY
jgi:putative ABC transport system substrate-binding protein